MRAGAGEADGICRTRGADCHASWAKQKRLLKEQIRALTAVLEGLPERLTREEAVFRLPDIVERVGNATAGLLGRDAVATSIERVLLSPEVVRLTRPLRSAEGRARHGAHETVFNPSHSADGAGTSGIWRQAWPPIRDILLPAQAIEAKVTGLLKSGYPLSEEQIAAIRTVTSSEWPGRHHRRSGRLGQDHNAAAYRRSLP